jgi:pteridine reductase
MAKVALITGSAVRLGREMALHLAKNGWHLALHYRNSAKDLEDLKATLLSLYPDQFFCTFCADFESTGLTSKLMGQVMDHFGHLDLLINSASVFEPSTLKQTSIDLLIRQMQVNFMTPLILMRDFANTANNGQIINMIDSRIVNNKSDYLAYSLSKKSLWELTKMAALELAPRFRVNAIAPGAILPPVGNDQQYLEKIAVNTPMKVPSGIKSFLKSLDFLIDNEDLTGQLIYIDGGAHLL